MAETEDNRKIGTFIKSYHGYRYYKGGNRVDYLLLFYRDEKGVKRTIYVPNPQFTYYLINDKTSPEAKNPPIYLDKSKAVARTVTYSYLLHDIAEQTNSMDFYNKVLFSEGERGRSMNNLMKHPWLYNADQDIEDFYIEKFFKDYKPDPRYKFKICYFDTEVNVFTGGLNGKQYKDFADPSIAPCPFSVITLVDGSNDVVHTFVLRDPYNPKMIDVEKNHFDEFKKRIHDKVLDYNKLDISVDIKFYDNELEMIKAFFATVHEIDPDYVLGWNSIEFDYQTLVNRLRFLLGKDKSVDTDGYQLDERVAEIVCDPKYYIRVDEKTGKEIYLKPSVRLYHSTRQKIGKRFDWVYSLDGSCWIDQMLLYGAVRVGTKFDSYKLNAIAAAEVNSQKQPFGPGENVFNQIFLDPVKFIQYNIQDTLLCMEIELKTQDISEYQSLADTTLTRKDKVFSKSISLINYIIEYAKGQNLVLRTNKNAIYGDLSDYYDYNYLGEGVLNEGDTRYSNLIKRKDRWGAFVSDPNLMDDIGEEIAGKRSNKLFKYLMDLDYSSLYPSIFTSSNLDSNHIVGKFYLIDDETKQKLKKYYGCEHMFDLSKKDIEKQNEASDDSTDDSDDSDDDNDSSKGDIITETDDLGIPLADFIFSQNWDKIGAAFMNLPTTDELVKKIEESRKK